MLLITHIYHFNLAFNFNVQVAILSECSEDMVDVAYQYGRNVGIAFQVRRNFFSEELILELYCLLC